MSRADAAILASATRARRGPAVDAVPPASPEARLPLHPCRAIVFDLAGVLIDSERAHEDAARRVAAGLRLDVPQDRWPRIRGGAYEDFFSQVLSLPANAGCGRRVAQVVLDAYDAYLEEVRRSAAMVPGAVGTLQAARKAFGLVALATSSEWRLVDATLGRFGLAGYFDGVISGDHLTQRKPAPEAFLVTAWLLGVRPDSMVVVEDSAHGIRSARMARTHVLGIATRCEAQALRGARPHHVVSDHGELLSHLEALSLAGKVVGRSHHAGDWSQRGGRVSRATVAAW